MSINIQTNVSFSDHNHIDFNKSGALDKVLQLDDYDEIISIQFILYECYTPGDITVLENIKLPKKLKKMYIEKCHITKLPELPTTLELLQCNHNKIKILPVLPNTLLYLNCEINEIIDIPYFPERLITKGAIHLIGNPINKEIREMFNPFKMYNKWRIDRQYAVDKISEWYLDCKWNPKYAKCRERLMSEFNELYEE